MHLQQKKGRRTKKQEEQIITNEKCNTSELYISNTSSAIEVK